MAWTAQEAGYAMRQLILRRKIRPADVEGVLRDRKKEIHRIRERLADLESLGGSLATGRRPARKRSAAKHPAPRHRKPRLSAKVRSRLRLQGRYMGYARRLTADQKAEVRKVRLEKGWQAAIRMAAGLVKAKAEK